MEVQTHKLDDVYLERKAHLLKLDIQGGELAVLEGDVRTLQTTLVIEVEVEFVPLYKNQPLFADIQGFLRQNDSCCTSSLIVQAGVFAHFPCRKILFF